MKRKIETNNAPKTPHLYSQAIESNGFIFVAGQVHVTFEGKLVAGTTEEKLAQIIRNISAILTEAGSGLDHVVKATVYVTDMTELKTINELYPKYFPGTPPAREAVCVQALPLGASIEISVIAEK